jgi:pSer/pThr/pTyr-binding forkhead associated (FHA) protein
VGWIDNNERTVIREPRVHGPQRLAPKPPAFEQVRGPGSPTVHLLDQPEIIIGRGEKCEIRVISTTLSRQHLSVLLRDGEVSFTDLESMNGVYLNGIRVHSAILRDGDVLELGDAAFVFWERAP